MGAETSRGELVKTFSKISVLMAGMRLNPAVPIGFLVLG